MIGARRTALAIAVPTYNEVESVQPLLDSLQKHLVNVPGLTTTVLFIDDDSPDGTAQAIETLRDQRSMPGFDIRILRRPRKEGLGRAYVDGLTTLLAEDRFDYILQMDADLSHHPRYISPMLAAAEHAELVIGSRYVGGGATPDWGWRRRLLSQGGNRYARLLLGSAITDYTGGFNLYAANVLRRVDLSSVQASGYGFQIELKYRALALTRQVREVPIIFLDRRVGQSKIPPNTILTNLLLVPRVRFTARAKAP